LEEAPQQRRCDRERRVGDDVVRLAGKAEVRRVGLHDHDVMAERGAQGAAALGVRFDGDHTRPARHEGRGERAVTGADVDHEGV
jgi:hypothetical protein